MGKNLWHLLLAPPPRHLLPKESSNKIPAQKPVTSNPPPTAQDTPSLGQFSHGTAYGFLASASGAEHMRDWRLQSPVKVIEKVKAMLLSERTGAEWEILEGNEWEEEEGPPELPSHPGGNAGRNLKIEDTGVLVPAQAETGVQYAGNGTLLPRIEETGVLVPEQEVTIRSGGAEQSHAAEGENTEEREKGKSGWTKLKSR